MLCCDACLRCRQLSLSWRLAKMVQRMAEDASERYGSNLFVIASKRFNGFDPELGDSVHPKNYSVGINIGF
ncbi:MAG: hypothetical protein ACLU4N_17190 [Butyricimonas faecihominis]